MYLQRHARTVALPGNSSCAGERFYVDAAPPGLDAPLFPCLLPAYLMRSCYGCPFCQCLVRLREFVCGRRCFAKPRVIEMTGNYLPGGRNKSRPYIGKSYRLEYRQNCPACLKRQGTAHVKWAASGHISQVRG